uniref:Uncharacterized protein n=1 Tax=Oryza rufipogon TaxID=4529 RepID=A0A0E0N4Q9_ORYRU
MFAPRPSAAVATACCGWYPSITMRMSSRSAIMVVPCCAHGQHTNCLMKCMVEANTSFLHIVQLQLIWKSTDNEM